VREARAQLNDLFLENDDIRDRLNDLENGASTEVAEVAEEKSADDCADDYFRDPGEQLVAAINCSLREEVRELRAQLADLFLDNDDIRNRLNDLENDEDTEDAAEDAAEATSADDYYRDPGEHLEAADREMEMAHAASDAGHSAAFTLRSQAEVKPASGGMGTAATPYSGGKARCTCVPVCAVIFDAPSSAVPVDWPRGGDYQRSPDVQAPAQSQEETTQEKAQRTALATLDEYRHSIRCGKTMNDAEIHWVAVAVDTLQAIQCRH
jgi:hypothetical protein